MNRDFDITPEQMEAHLLKLTETAEETRNVLKSARMTFENLNAAWQSANAEKFSGAMIDCIQRANKVADNMDTINKAVTDYKNSIIAIDEA